MDKDKKKNLNEKVERPSHKKMGYVYPKRIKQIMHGETPVITSIPSQKKSEEETGEEIVIRGEKYKIFTDVSEKRYIKMNGINVDVRFYEEDGYTVPMFCPVCNANMIKIDEKFWRLRGKCHRCVAEDETKMRINGTYKEYEQEKIKQNYISFLKDSRDSIIDALKNSIKKEYTYINEDGTMEKWTNNQYKEQKDFLENELKWLDKQIDIFENPQNYDDNNNYIGDQNEK